jgi:hypothetical protein
MTAAVASFIFWAMLTPEDSLSLWRQGKRGAPFGIKIILAARCVSGEACGIG